MTRFIASSDKLEGARVALFGAPFDCTASFRPGARFGPAAIREVSDGLETYSPVADHDLEDFPFADLGDVELGFGAARPAIEAVRDQATAILDAGAIPFMLGGEHSLTAGPVEACLKKYGALTVLQIDAHADLRKDYLGDPDSHACVMNRCLELGATIAQFGIRSGTRKEFSFMLNHDTLSPIEEIGRYVQAMSEERPVYITVDIDAFDPSLVPGTGTPEPGGIFWSDFRAFIQSLRDSRLRVVGMDVMELAPQLDASGVSSIVAAKCVRDMMLAI